MEKLPWILLIGGILLFIVGVLLAVNNFPANYIPGLVIGVIGALIAMLGFTKLRNKLNNWMDTP